MKFHLDRPQAVSAVLLAIGLLCLLVMAANGTRFVLASRSGVPQTISILLIAVISVIPMAIQFLLRNLGGLLLVLAGGITGGGTVISLIYANANGHNIDISWMQTLFAVSVLLVAIIGIIKMDVDWTDVGIDDLLS